MNSKVLTTVLVLGSVAFVGLKGYGEYQSYQLRQKARKALAARQAHVVEDPEEEMPEHPTRAVKAKKHSQKPQVVRVVVHETQTVEVPAKVENRPVAEVKAEKKKKVTLEDARDALENVNDMKDNVQGIFGM